MHRFEADVRTSAVVFPFDLFGGAGAADGARLVADELREVLADNRRETVETRARCYTDQVRLREIEFADVEAIASWRRTGRQQVRQALRQGDFLLWIGGNHLAALPVYDEIAALGDGELVIQFDAHLDIHHFADCATDPTHGNFLLHIEGTRPPILNVGHRELLLKADYIAQHYRQTIPANELTLDTTAARKEVRRAVATARRVWIDIDWDVLDPAYFSAVSRPVPFGLSPAVLLGLLDLVWSPQVAGVMLSEFVPSRDRNDESLAIVTWLIEWLLLRRYESAVTG
jgi:agmatinase